IGLAEVELAVGALPHEESAQALLAGGANHEFGIRLALGVQVLRDLLDRDAVGELLGGLARGEAVAQVGAHGIGYLVATSVPDGDVDVEAAVARGLLARRRDALGGLGGQERRVANVLESPPPVLGE